jgi:hypothetical protein
VTNLQMMLKCHRICSHFPVIKWTAKKMVFVCMVNHLSCCVNMTTFEIETQTHQDNSSYAKDSAYKLDQLQKRVTADENRRCQCSVINRNNDKRIQHPFCTVRIHLSVGNTMASLNVSVVPKRSVSTTVLQEVTKHAYNIRICDCRKREGNVHQGL